MQVLDRGLVSVLVPAYNCALTIERSINSLLCQDYKEIEIIITDDGSTDDTENIVRKLQSRDKRISYYRIAHKGVSAVRNACIERSIGKYVMFVDADDYVERNFVSRMVSAIEVDKKCDMSICSYQRVVYGRFFPVERLQKSGLKNSKEYLYDTLKDPGHHYFGVLWNKIFKREIITDHDLRFREDITLGEDFVFSLEYLRHTRSVNVINDRLYYYCYQENSTLSRIHEKSIIDCRSEMANRIKIFEVYKNTMESFGMINYVRKRLYHYWIVFYLRQIYSLVYEYKWSSNDSKKWKEELEACDEIKRAFAFFGEFEIRAEYASYKLVQSVKKCAKKIVKLIYVGLSQGWKV